MKHFTLVHAGLDVAPILAELEAHPALWNEHSERTADNAGPMAGTGDIWIRYFPHASLREPADYLRENRPVFYPAWQALPSIQPVVHSLMAMCCGVELGGILISRIPAGGEIKPHVDGAAWSARYYNRKFYVPLKANARCVNTCGEDEVVFRVGEIWEFDNLVTHSVLNHGTTERVTLIVTLRSADA
jgi:hypothetical protein